MDLAQLSVIVTGASGGLGRAIAAGLARDGATVTGFGRSAAGLEQTRAQCPPGKMFCVTGNLTQRADVESLFNEAIRRTGRVDVLINNGALYPKKGFIGEPFADWEQAVLTNLIGTARCCHIALPGMLERGFGRIVNVGTFAWLGPIPDSSAYSASKGAIRPFTRALASEVDRNRYPDVLINEFIPGVYRTGMSEQGEEPDAVYPHLRFVISRPSGGPTGQTYFKNELLQEPAGLRARIKQTIRRATLGLYRAE